MRLGIETLLNHYKILGLLGEGGMGEVYRALDTTLKREVTIKVLPSRLASDPAALARFEREAVVLAALNHPHIGTIHGLERSGDVRFLVLELVEGPTLAERLKSGPISVPEAIGIATQIADALEAAHEKGVIHRDLKPSNIKLTGGKVKVLDFGLAKALAETEMPDPSDSPTIRDTRAGVVVGTAAYMSPEQAEGKAVDKRTDVWAFGVVLYEMLAGQRLFEGRSTSHIIVHVMEQEPDWSKLPPLPGGVLDLLERCLQKDPAQRLRDIGDVKIQLRAAIAKPLRSSAQSTSSNDISRRRLGVAAAVIAVLAIVVLGAAFYLRQPAPVDESPITLQIPRQSGDSSASNVLILSPDGLRLAYIATAGGRSQLWVRVLKTNEARPLEGTDTVVGIPFWSSDSRYLFFSSSDAKLKKIEATGGPAQFLANLGNIAVSGFTLGEDKIVFGMPGRGLLQLSSKGGDPTPLLDGASPGNLFPSEMPDGNVLYCSCTASNPGIYIASPNGGAPRKVLNDASSVVYAPTVNPDLGYILFLRGSTGQGTTGTLMAQEINPRSLLLLKDPFPIAEQVANAGFSASKTGRLAFASGGATVPLGIPGMMHGQLTWLNRDGKTLSKLNT